MARVCKKFPHLGPHLPYGFHPKNAIFWSRSILTPLIAWKTQTNIGKQLCISQCPTRGPKSTKIELLDQILALGSDLEVLKCGLKNGFFDFFLNFFKLFSSNGPRNLQKPTCPSKYLTGGTGSAIFLQVSRSIGWRKFEKNQKKVKKFTFQPISMVGYWHFLA